MGAGTVNNLSAFFFPDVGRCHNLRNCLISETVAKVLASRIVFDCTAFNPNPKPNPNPNPNPNPPIIKNRVLAAGKHQRNQECRWPATPLIVISGAPLAVALCLFHSCPRSRYARQFHDSVTLCRAEFRLKKKKAHPAQPKSFKSLPTVLYIDRSIDVPGRIHQSVISILIHHWPKTDALPNPCICTPTKSKSDRKRST